jgi:NAD-dependent deacetylase
MRPAIEPNKIVVLSGAGISAESGIPTFRDGNGLWHNHDLNEVATPGGWARNPQLVLDFYNERRSVAAAAQPNAAHLALAELESKYDVIVLTQNIDDLHERAGSTKVIHLHGELTWARGTSPRKLRRHIGASPIMLGDLCEDGSQLRPDIVWFGEPVDRMDQAVAEIRTAAKVLVVGTSLTVFPVASLAKKARWHAEKVLCAFDVERRPAGYTLLRGAAGNIVPGLVRRWMEQAPAH